MSQGVPPATVAEWTLQGSGNQDFYDGASDNGVAAFNCAEFKNFTQCPLSTDMTFRWQSRTMSTAPWQAAP